MSLHIPILSDIAPGGFSYKANYLIEFESNSLWYETSLTIAANALKMGIKTQYHSFMHIPSEVRQSLEQLGVDLKKLESEDKFRFIDTYTPLTGLPHDTNKGMSGHPMVSIDDPLFLKKYTENVGDLFKKGADDSNKRWIHIDDNASIFNRYLKEEDVLKMFNTQVLPETRTLEIAALHSVVTGVYSDSFYKQFETQCDGIIDFKAEEDDGQLENYVRVRSLRGRTCDSKWRHLHLEPTGEVVLEKTGGAKKKEIGISGWLKGPRRK